MSDIIKKRGDIMWLEKLKEMKKQSGKTSKQISDETGVPKSTIDKLFSGQTKEPYISSTKLIVNCLGYTLDDLFSENEKSFKSSYKPNIDASEITDVKKMHLLNNYDFLNERGKEKLLEYSEDLVNSSLYIENEQKEKHA